MLKIYLARHGQDEDNAAGILNGHRDQPLTALGLQQAQTLAENIIEAELTFDKIYSSPLKRAYVTAQTVAKSLNIDQPEILNDLIERDFGIMSGKRNEDIEPMCAPDILKAEIITYFLSPEGAETFPDLIKRGKKAIEFIKNHHKEGSILLVSHGDLCKMIYAAYYDLNWKDVLTQFHLGNSELLLLAEDSAPQEAHVFRFAQHNH